MDRNTSESLWSRTKPSLNNQSKSWLLKRCARKRVINAAQSYSWLILSPPSPCSESPLVHICFKTATIQPLSDNACFPAVYVCGEGEERRAFIRCRYAVKVL